MKRSVRPGELVAGAAGVVLLAAMFLGWYTVDSRDDELSAWAAFGFVDVVLALVALLGIALAVSHVVGRGPSLPLALAVVTITLGLAGTLLLAYRILDQPGPNDLISVSPGAWIGLVASLAVFLGAWLSLSDERPRPVDPPPPEPQRQPTPARS